MKTTKAKWWLLPILLAFYCPHFVAAQILINADFQSDIPGTVPSVVALEQSNGTNRIVTTTDSASDPFGIPGNQSLRLVDQNGTGLGYRAVIPFGETFPTSYSNATIEMDMVLGTRVGGWSVTNIFVGDTLGNDPQWFPDGQALQIFPATSAPTNGSVGQIGGIYSQNSPGGGGKVITENVPFHLKIVMNASTSTYNVFVDDTLLGWDFGSGTIFDIPAGVDTVNQITFTSEGLGVPTMGDVFVDNFKVTIGSIAPENADFDSNGDIDGRDFLIWQRGFGTGSTLADGDANGDGSVDELDLGIWQNQYGSEALIAFYAIPEPSSMLLVAIGISCLVLKRD